MVRPLLQTLRNLISPVSPNRDGVPQRTYSYFFKVAFRAWLIFAIGLTVKNVFSLHEHTNYPTYEYGARCLLDDINMYESEQGYRYGPAFAVAMLPLAMLPTQLGSFLFIWGNVIIFYLVLRELIAEVLPGNWTAWNQGMYLILALWTTNRMFWSLQINPMVFAAVAGAALAVKQKRWWPASFLLATAVHIKVWPIAAALLFLACWPRQLTWRFVVALLVLGAAPLLVRPPHMVWQQYIWWYDVLSGPAQIRHDYRDAWTIWNLIHPPVSSMGYTVLQLLAAMLTLAACLWQKRRGSDVTYLLTLLLGLWTAWQMVFGPATEGNTFGVIGPMIAWAMVTAWVQPWRRGWMSISFLLTDVLALDQVERTLMPNVPWILAAHPIGAAMFAIWLVGYIRQWGVSPPSCKEQLKTEAMRG
jgi:alpha-1,2-mannosyltransferase